MTVESEFEKRISILVGTTRFFTPFRMTLERAFDRSDSIDVGTPRFFAKFILRNEGFRMTVGV